MTRGISKDKDGGAARLCTPVANWPAKDREIWQSALTKGTPFDDNGARAKLRPITNRGVEKGYGRWLDFLARHDPASLAAPAATRITRVRVRAYIAGLMESGNHLATIGLRVEHLRSAARVIEPSSAWDWLKTPARNLRTRSQPKRDKRERLVAAADLTRLGVTLMEEAPQQARPGHAAVHFRDGLITALLISVPLRLKNLSELTLGATLRKIEGRWLISLPGSETKTHKPYEVGWPDHLVKPLEQYLAVWRPLLAGRRRTSPIPAGDWLWISAEGRPLSAKRINHAIKLRTEAAFGRRVNPHLFRDAAATSMAIGDPANIGIMTAVLGHATPATMERHYQQASSLQAQRAYAQGLASLRGDL